MNKQTIYFLKALRKLYKLIFCSKPERPFCEQNPDRISQLIYDSLINENPCMIARFGSNELNCLKSYIGVKANNRNVFTYITAKSDTWWWNEINLDNMCNVAGFFPRDYNYFEKFGETMLQDIPLVDILGSWQPNEKYVDNLLIHAQKVDRGLIDPFFTKKPWTKALEAKKVLVVHPFKTSIENQYKRKDLIFPNGLIPDFELTVIPAVQSLAGEKTQFNDWFEALEFMKDEIDKVDYDICIIGAGAYGFHLAAHVKRRGKKSIHIGGSLQLLFGIIGKRWETPGYAKSVDYSALINEYWVRPTNEEAPKRKELVENGCYY